MDITLSNKQIQQIADMTAKLVLRRIKGERRSEPVLVSVRDAARILGVSELDCSASHAPIRVNAEMNALRRELSDLP